MEMVCGHCVCSQGICKCPGKIIICELSLNACLTADLMHTLYTVSGELGTVSTHELIALMICFHIWS